MNQQCATFQPVGEDKTTMALVIFNKEYDCIEVCANGFCVGQINWLRTVLQSSNIGFLTPTYLKLCL